METAQRKFRLKDLCKVTFYPGKKMNKQTPSYQGVRRKARVHSYMGYSGPATKLKPCTMQAVCGSVFLSTEVNSGRKRRTKERLTCWSYGMESKIKINGH